MTETTARLALPLLAPGQAQKEMTHNEALTVIDMTVQASVVAVGLVAPPADPAPGECWIVGAAPAGAWSGHADAIAGWTAGGWRFVVPRPGMALWVAASNRVARFGEDGWRIGEIIGDSLEIGGATMLSTPSDPVAPPDGGTTIDGEARTAILGIIQTLQHHGLMANA